ncbi:MAG: hypothetical protein Q9196_000160 [Gyalolechia fulgens]
MDSAQIEKVQGEHDDSTPTARANEDGQVQPKPVTNKNSSRAPKQQEGKSQKARSTTKHVDQREDKEAELVAEFNRKLKIMKKAIDDKDLLISNESRNLDEVREVLEDLVDAIATYNLGKAQKVVLDLTDKVGAISFTAQRQEALVTHWRGKVNDFAGEAAYRKARYESELVEKEKLSAHIQKLENQIAKAVTTIDDQEEQIKELKRQLADRGK